MAKKQADTDAAPVVDEAPVVDKKAFATGKQFAKSLGVEMKEPLSTREIQGLVKPLPGYTNLLDNVAQLLAHDAEALNLKDVKPQQLLDLQAERSHLAEKEAISFAVYTSVHHQRMVVDDQAMALLLKINRRVLSRQEEDPDLYNRWKAVRDFLSNFHKGRPASTPQAVAATAAAGGTPTK